MPSLAAHLVIGRINRQVAIWWRSSEKTPLRTVVLSRFCLHAGPHVRGPKLEKAVTSSPPARHLRVATERADISSRLSHAFLDGLLGGIYEWWESSLAPADGSATFQITAITRGRRPAWRKLLQSLRTPEVSRASSVDWREYCLPVQDQEEIAASAPTPVSRCFKISNADPAAACSIRPGCFCTPTRCGSLNVTARGASPACASPSSR